MLLKCCTQYASKFGKLSSGHRTGKGQFSFQPQRKAMNAKEFSNYHTIVLISHASKVMLKILQARLQEHVNWELPDIQAGFRKGRGPRDQIANTCWIIDKAREFQKNIYFCFIDYAEAFDCVDHNKLWKILKEMGIPDHLTCLLRYPYAGQEATVSTGHGTTDWFQIGKRVSQICVFALCLFNFLCRVHHLKSQAGWSTSWSQDCQEKYQWLQICRWHNPCSRKQRGTKEPLDESERGEWKSWLKTQDLNN